MTSWTMEKSRKLRLLSLLSSSSPPSSCWATKTKQFKLFIIQQLLRQDTVLRGEDGVLKHCDECPSLVRIHFLLTLHNNSKHPIERCGMNISWYQLNLRQVTSSLRRGWVSRFTVQFFHFHHPFANKLEEDRKTLKMNAWTWEEQVSVQDVGGMEILRRLGKKSLLSFIW